jgi:hypothetical protein
MQPMYYIACITSLPQPWSAAMEATLFTGWIYDQRRLSL